MILSFKIRIYIYLYHNTCTWLSNTCYWTRTCTILVVFDSYILVHKWLLENSGQNDVRKISWWWTLRLCICTLSRMCYQHVKIPSYQVTIPSYQGIHFIFTDRECWNQNNLQGNDILLWVMTQDSSVLQPCSIVILVYRVSLWGTSSEATLQVDQYPTVYTCTCP